VEGFIGHMENFIYGIMQIRLCYESVWLKIRMAQQILVEVSYFEFLMRSVIQLMGYMEKPIYGLMQTKVYSGSVWMKIGVAQQLLVKVSHTEF
jgi:hypothetical protein